MYRARVDQCAVRRSQPILAELRQNRQVFRQLWCAVAASPILKNKWAQAPIKQAQSAITFD
jgi:hypothetical protein